VACCGARKAGIEIGADQPERRVQVEHRLQRADPAQMQRDQQVGRACDKRAGGDRKRADQAVARENVRALCVQRPMRERGLFERHMHADVTGRRIHRADEGDEGDEDEMLEAGDRHSGQHHQRRAREQQRAQVIARRQKADGHGGGGRA